MIKWPFSQSKRSQVEVFREREVDVINLVADRWREFSTKMPFRGSNALALQISAFTDPMIEGVRLAFPELKRSPDAAVFYCVIKGISAANTHTTDELEAAFAAIRSESEAQDSR